MNLDAFVFREDADDEGAGVRLPENSEALQRLSKDVIKSMPISGFVELEEDQVEFVLVGPPDDEEGKGLSTVMMTALAMFSAARVKKYHLEHGSPPRGVAVRIELVFDESPQE